MAAMVRAGQFTLKSLLVATAILAADFFAAQYIVPPNDLTGRLIAVLIVPLFVCGAVGAFYHEREG